MLVEAPYTLRLARTSDSEAIWSLIAGVLSEHGIVADRGTTDGDLVDVEQSYNDSGGAFMVLMDRDRLIGTVALSRDSANTCELCRMYLATEYRGRGLGRFLLESGLEHAAACGFREVRLETAAVLTEAIGLYRSAGFDALDEAPVGRNCNLVMVKHLTPKGA